MRSFLLQPGVASVYCSIVQQTRTGVECYVRSFPQLHGLTFAEVRRRFDSAVAIGFMAKGGALRINPHEEETLDDGARVIALAPNGAPPLDPATFASPLCHERWSIRGRHQPSHVLNRAGVIAGSVSRLGACATDSGWADSCAAWEGAAGS